MTVRIRLRGIDRELQRLEREALRLSNRELRRRASQLELALSIATPKDTGAASESWDVSILPNQFTDVDRGIQGSSFTGIPSRSKDDVLYLTNGVTYIDDLNAGSSQQAPARFVETTAARFFEVTTPATVRRR